MNLSEVIREDKQRDGGFQVVPFAAESIRQARKSAHSHPNRKVHTLDVRRANQIGIRVAEPRLNDCAFQSARRVPRRAFCHSGVNLNQLTIVNPRSEAQANRVRISGHAIGRQLELAYRRLIQLLDKDFGINAGTASKVPREDDLAVAFDGEECVSIALALVIRVALVPLLTVDVSPQLICLNVFHGHLADVLLQNALALLASNLEDAKHGRNSHVAQPGRASHATAFAQAIQNAKELIVGQVDRLGRLAGSLREGALTIAAFESRRFVAAKVAVKIGIASTIVWTLHGITKSFLTGITVGTTMRLRALLGIYGAGQVMSLRGVRSTSSDSRLGLAATVGFKPTEPEGSAALQAAPIDRSGTSPSIQISSRLLLCSIFQLLLLPRWLALPFIGGLPGAVRSGLCLVGCYKTLQDRVDARQRVLLLAQVITRAFQPVSNLLRRARRLRDCQSVATGISQSNHRQARRYSGGAGVVRIFHQRLKAQAGLLQSCVPSVEQLPLFFNLGHLLPYRFVSFFVVLIHNERSV
jgi:hypothetical protein